jgi:hypothetical protein
VLALEWVAAEWALELVRAAWVWEQEEWVLGWMAAESASAGLAWVSYYMAGPRGLEP